MDAVAELLRSALVGRYEVERELGRGGMSVVFLARDTRHDRLVALKVLLPELSGSIGTDRFLREIRLAAGFQHPHIVPLFDSGEAGGFLYSVMPYVEGESLRSRLEREGQLPLQDAVRIAREVAEALQYSHDRDVVHRDIKPENIMLSGGHALVLDFGIARAINAAGGTRLTEAGLAVGTPAYMSPEQGVADPRVDGRADVYALGCVLYEMLAGTRPFSGPTPQAAMAQHAVASIPPLERADPAVSEALDAVLAKALAKAPADRFATAGEFGAALATAASPAFAITGTRNSARRPARVILMAGFLVLASLGAWVASLQIGPFAESRRSSRPESSHGVVTAIAVLPLRNDDGSEGDAHFANGLTQELTNALTRISGIAPRPYASVATEAAKGGDPLALGRRLEVDYVVAGTLWRSRERVRVIVELIRVADGVLVWSQRSFGGADADIFAVQDSITAQLVSEVAGPLSAVANAAKPARGRRDPEAYDLYLRGRQLMDSARLEEKERALSFFEKAVGRDSSFADAWLGIAGAYAGLAQISGRTPTELVARWKGAAEQAIKFDSLNGEARVHRALIRSWFEWDHEGAHSEYRRAVALTPGSARLRLAYSQFLNTVGLHDSALAEVQRARVLDPTDPTILTNLSWRLAFLGKLDSASAAAERALAADSGQWVAHVSLSGIAAARGDTSRAIAEAERAARIMGDVPMVLSHLAYRYGRAGRRTDATAVLDRITALARDEYVEGVWLARAHLGLGDRHAALDALEASARAGDADLAWQLSLGMFEALRGESRYERLLQRTKVERYVRGKSPTFLW